MTTILDKILETKRSEIAEARRRVPIEMLVDQAAAAPPTRSFAHALINGPGRVRLIAEVKKASPSAGIIREAFEPVEIATAYASAGAAGISVLTDRTYFQGDLEFLRQIRNRVETPLLRKDFIVDRYQLLEARAAGADCVLLIAECLAPRELEDLHLAALELKLETLIELYDLDNLPTVLDAGGKIVGINNRDLRTFVTDLEHTIRLRREIPDDRIVVSESGIRTTEDVERLAAAGVQAMLVGESLMRQDNLSGAVRELIERA